MVKTVYWTVTNPCTLAAGANPVVFLRFGSTTGTAVDRVNQWKNYCPLPLVIAGTIQSVDSIGGQPDDAIRSRLLAANFNLSQPGTQIDWFQLPEAQPGGAAVAALVNAAFAGLGAGVQLTAANIGNVIAAMANTMNP